MLDAHVHLERGPYTLDWLVEFIGTAQRRGIDDLYLLEHTHRFVEFRPLYDSFVAHNAYQADWFTQRNIRQLGDYTAFIRHCRQLSFPIRLHFGLEVCYEEGREDFLGSILGQFDWDFLTGSVHWIDGWGFDHQAEFWEGRDVDALYRSYYAKMLRLAESGLFTHLAHPDSIKCFGHRPTVSLASEYRALAESLARQGMKAEFSAGLANNYGCRELGMSPELLQAMRLAGVNMVTASDAHAPEMVGRNIRACQTILEA